MHVTLFEMIENIYSYPKINLVSQMVRLTKVWSMLQINYVGLGDRTGK